MTDTLALNLDALEALERDTLTHNHRVICATAIHRDWLEGTAPERRDRRIVSLARAARIHTRVRRGEAVSATEVAAVALHLRESLDKAVRLAG